MLEVQVEARPQPQAPRSRAAGRRSCNPPASGGVGRVRPCCRTRRNTHRKARERAAKSRGGLRRARAHKEAPAAAAEAAKHKAQQQAADSCHTGVCSPSRRGECRTRRSQEASDRGGDGGRRFATDRAALAATLLSLFANGYGGDRSLNAPLCSSLRPLRLERGILFPHEGNRLWNCLQRHGRNG